MTLISSISGIRGTIGGLPGQGLTPVDVVRYATAYAHWLNLAQPGIHKKVVVGRDARVSGRMVSELVLSTLNSMGIDVIDIGLSTTPTVAMTVPGEEASGGIIVTASHNPWQWNALKLLNANGEFLNDKEGKQVVDLSTSAIQYSEVHLLGIRTKKQDWIDRHIEMILALPLVDRQAIRDANFTIAVDAVNSSGGIAVPRLLEALGVNEIIPIYCTPDGAFPHNPEPLPANLEKLISITRDKAHLGIAVDPDVDRLAFVCEDGRYFGEEYTLVAIADYILGHHPGNTVSNLSSTQALKDITEKHGGQYFASAVGEVNVVAEMKRVSAVIGGEGNGGVIYPPLHYGRDALVGIALFLSHMARTGQTASTLRSQYPSYAMSKHKVTLDAEMNLDEIMEGISTKYIQQPQILIDGVKIIFGKEWVHLRKSNTEPVIRIYAESDSESKAEVLARKVMEDMRSLIFPDKDPE